MKFTTLVSTLALLVGSVIAQGGATTSSIPSGSVSSPTIALPTPSPLSPTDISLTSSVTLPASSVTESGVVSILPISIATTTTTSRPSSTTTSTTTMDSISQSSPIPSETSSANGGLPTALAGMQQVAMGVVAGLVGAVVL